MNRSSNWPRSHDGFSLTELLVVIGIMTVILGMIVPAIQRAREAANKLTCASNLRQLGVAAHHYHANHGRLPPGYLGPSLANNANSPSLFYEGQWIGHYPLLLPYLEGDVAVRQLSVDFTTTSVSQAKWFWSAPATGPGPPHLGNYQAAMTRLKIFRCPSASDYAPRIGDPTPSGGGAVLGLHVYNDTRAGVRTVGWKDEYGSATPFRPLGRTNYMGVAGCGSGNHPLYSKYQGIYTNRSQLSLGQITTLDGTSNTLLYGETCGTRWQGEPESEDICWMAGGGLGTYLGLERARNAVLIQFSSYHTAGVPFCFADGSVRTVRYIQSTDTEGNYTHSWFLLQQLAGYKDGASADTTEILD